MLATQFECRHPRVVQQSIFACGLLTYLIDPDDVVWGLIKGAGAHARPLERTIFALAAFLLLGSASIATWVDATNLSGRPAPSGLRWRYVSGIAYAVGLATLFPLAGFIIVVGGETLRLARAGSCRTLTRNAVVALGWDGAMRKQVLKWALCFSMIVFSITLSDPLVERLIGMSLAATLIIHWREVREAFAGVWKR